MDARKLVKWLTWVLLLLFGACNAGAQVVPDKITVWEAGVPWVDPGVTVTDDSDVLYNFETPPWDSKVTIVGSVNVKIPASYTITYSIIDTAGSPASAVRQVDVKDTTKPVVTLIGAALIIVRRGDPYVEPGANGSDLPRASTCPVTMSGGPNTSIIGTYTRTYTSTDASGNTSLPVFRTIKVIGQGPKIVVK